MGLNLLDGRLYLMNWTVEVAELENFLRESNMESLVAVLDDWNADYDINQDGKLNYKEFLRFITDLNELAESIFIVIYVNYAFSGFCLKPFLLIYQNLTYLGKSKITFSFTKTVVKFI